MVNVGVKVKSDKHLGMEGVIVYVVVSSFSMHSLLVELLSPCVVNTLV
jgi:hypothetical protein